MVKKMPDSFKKIYHMVVKLLLGKFVKLSIWVKILVIIILLLLFVILSRNHVLPEFCFRLTTIFIREPKPTILLTLDGTVWHANEARQLRKGEMCSTGDNIILTAKPNANCWLALFCIDSKGTHPVSSHDFEPIFVKEEKPITKEFCLDSTIGPEVYYVVASNKKFNFEKVIRPALMRLSVSPAFKFCFLRFLNEWKNSGEYPCYIVITEYAKYIYKLYSEKDKEFNIILKEIEKIFK